MKGFRILLFMFVGIVLIWGTSFAKNEIGAVERAIWDNFDNLQYWTVSSWSDQGEVSQSKKYAPEGQRSLKFQLTKEGQRFQKKGAVLEKEQIALDIDSTKKIILDVYNDAGPMEMAIVLHTGDFCESSTVKLNKGWNKDIVFDLGASDFKSSASKWRYNYTIPLNSIAWRLMLIFYRGTIEEGDLYISNIRIDKIARVSGDQTPVAKKDYQKPKVIKLTPNEKTLKEYEKIEITVDFEGTYQYPFDPEDISLDAEFISPSGLKYQMPGFLYSADINGIKITNAVWMIRFSTLTR